MSKIMPEVIHESQTAYIPGRYSGYSVFAHYNSARRWYAPHDLAKVNSSEIERVTKMDI